MKEIYIVINGIEKKLNKDNLDKEFRFWTTYCFMNRLDFTIKFKEVKFI